MSDQSPKSEKPLEKSSKKRLPVIVDWMAKEDYITDDSPVVRMEKACSEFPWTAEDFADLIRKGNVIGKIAVTPDKKIAGFMMYEQHKDKLHLINFAVDPDHRHQGVGKAMVEHLLSKLNKNRRWRITLEVRETDLPAQLFFKEAFKDKAMIYTGKVLRNFYKDTGEDAFQMEYKMDNRWSEMEPRKNRLSQYFKDKEAGNSWELN